MVDENIQYLVDIVNGCEEVEKFDIPMVVLVDGHFISGRMVSYKTYLESFTKFKDSLGYVLFKELEIDYNKLLENNLDNKNSELRKPNFMHIMVNNVIPKDVHLEGYEYPIRIKLENISAYMLGSISKREELVQE